MRDITVVTTLDPAPLDTVVAVLPTPFHDDGGLDLDGFERILRRAVEGGLRAVTIAGNTGEFGALSADEIGRLTDVASAALTGQAALIVGVGGDLGTARQVAAKAAATGAFGVMVHEPTGPFRSPEGWRRYHAEVAEAAPGLAVVPYVRDPAIGAEDLRLRRGGPSCRGGQVRGPGPDPLCRPRHERRDLLWICGLAESWAPFFRPAGASAFTSGLAVVEPRLSLALLEHLRRGRADAALASWAG